MKLRAPVYLEQFPCAGYILYFQIDQSWIMEEWSWWT